jgi:GT2 family glycosyltransferase
LCYRWQQQGYLLRYVPDAIVDHYHYLTLWTFCKQHFCYGMGAYRYRRTRARQRPQSFRQEYRFILDVRHWLGYPLRKLAGRRRYLIVGLFLVWQIANTAGFIWQAVTERVK